MLLKKLRKILRLCDHDYKPYSYTTKTVMVNGEKQVEYDKRRLFCCNCGKATIK